MQSMNIYRKQSGCVREMRGGGAARSPLAILAPFCTLLAGKWYIPKLAPILLLSRIWAALAWWFYAEKSDLGEGVGKVCSVGDPDATGCGCQHRRCDTLQPLHAFKPDQACGLRGERGI